MALLPNPGKNDPSQRAAASARLPVRAVNLGGWLVTEGWILPSLFDGIPNKDLLDGTQLQFKSVTQNAYVAAEQGGGAALVANRAQASGWETFKLWRIDETTFNLKVFGNQFVGVNSNGSVVATATTPGKLETFKLVRNAGDQSKMRIMAPNGLFLKANKDSSVTADYGQSTSWGNDDPSVFKVTRLGEILPSDGIPNKDLLDGTQLQFKSVTQNAYVAAEQGGGTALVANRAQASGWETFRLWRIDETTFNLMVFGNQFVGVNSNGSVVATAATPGKSETFKLVRNAGDLSKMRIMAPNGLFLQANKDSSVTADYGQSTSWGDDDPSVFKVTRLGGILPSLFDDIPNKDLLDGTQLQFKSVTQNAYVAAEQGGGTALVANRAQASSWETFRLWRIDKTTFNLKVFGNQFVGVNSNGSVVASATTPGKSETFKLVRNDGDPYKMRIMAPNGLFLQANKDSSVTADYGQSTSWGNDDPSVFTVTRVAGMQGEYQICNGYGTAKATPVLRNHWNTYIVEDDFRFMSESGLTAVRIPVGWWIASDPNPPAPYVPGSLEILDKAFKWAEKYNLGVIVDLHAAPGSQNPFEHSSSRDGSQEWGTSDGNIAQTVQVIDFLASRYATSPSLLAVELMNEPLAPGVSLESLKKYYRDGYNAVRKHSSKAYVIMSNRLAADSTELLGFASGFPAGAAIVIDVHYYTLFNSMFDTFTVQQNNDFIKTNYSNDLANITRQNGPLTFVGEWVAEWALPNATKEQYQMFAKAQMDVYGKATFGWAYWTFKNVNNHWSMEWMIKNGYITLTN